MQIKIKMAQAHQWQRENENVQRELASIQEYVNQNISNLEEEAVYFIPLQGNYIHVKRTMVLAGVIVSTMKKRIQGIEGCLKTRLKESVAEAAKVRFEFPMEFLGRLDCAEGFPVHFEIPVKGMQQDQKIRSSSLQCELAEVKILSIDDVEDKNEKN